VGVDQHVGFDSARHFALKLHSIKNGLYRLTISSRANGIVSTRCANAAVLALHACQSIVQNSVVFSVPAAISNALDFTKRVVSSSPLASRASVPQIWIGPGRATRSAASCAASRNRVGADPVAVVNPVVFIEQQVAVPAAVSHRRRRARRAAVPVLSRLSNPIAPIEVPGRSKHGRASTHGRRTAPF